MPYRSICFKKMFYKSHLLNVEMMIISRQKFAIKEVPKRQEKLLHIIKKSFILAFLINQAFVQLYSFIQSFKFEEGVATYFINFFQEMHENNELKTRPALKLHRLKLITMKIKLVALQPMHCILPYSTHNVQLPQQNTYLEC